MQTHVLLQIIQTIAPAITVVALVRHEITVHDYVTVQMADLFEPLTADGADVRAFIHMRG